MPNDFIESYDADVVAELERYDRLRKQWVDRHATFDGFDAWLATEGSS
jgi:hypothetical protein